MNNIDYLIEELLKENDYFGNISLNSLDEKKEFYRALRNIREPKYISDEYLKRQDEFLREEIKNKGIVNSDDIPFDEDIISVWQGDITTLRVDAIVNACNEYLLGCFIPGHKCIDNAIHSFAGMQLRNECDKIMKGKTLPNGEVVLTHGYNLPCRYIIQTVGPQVHGMVFDHDKEDLRKCYYNCLELSRKCGIKSIAFPCISTGLYGFPKDEASKIAIKTVMDYIKENDFAFDHIIFNVFEDVDYKIYKKNL